MKILITGAQGQLGKTILETFTDFSVKGMDRNACDITSPENINTLFLQERPDILINCAAYTNVEKAESDADQAYLVNAEACAFLAENCASANIPLIHISTDYVFDGNAQKPYTENDIPNPINIYGRSKLAGESHIQQLWEKHIILRVSSVFSKHGNNFVNTMIHLFNHKTEVRVVNDQIHCPTSTASIADALFAIALRLQNDANFNAWGIYHYCDNPETTWFDFAEKIKALMQPQMLEALLPIPMKEYVTQAKRPAYSALDCGKIQEVFGIKPQNWQAELIKHFALKEPV